MDSVEYYRKTIYGILDYYAKIPVLGGGIESLVIVSEDRNNYFLIHMGWQNDLRVHGMVVHVQIIDNKIWIQRDGIEDGITDELLEAGIPKDKIVLAFHPPELRKYTEFAVS